MLPKNRTIYTVWTCIFVLTLSLATVAATNDETDGQNNSDDYSSRGMANFNPSDILFLQGAARQASTAMRTFLVKDSIINDTFIKNWDAFWPTGPLTPVNDWTADDCSDYGLLILELFNEVNVVLAAMDGHLPKSAAELNSTCNALVTFTQDMEILLNSCFEFMYALFGDIFIGNLQQLYEDLCGPNGAIREQYVPNAECIGDNTYLAYLPCIVPSIQVAAEGLKGQDTLWALCCTIAKFENCSDDSLASKCPGTEELVTSVIEDIKGDFVQDLCALSDCDVQPVRTTTAPTTTTTLSTCVATTEYCVDTFDSADKTSNDLACTAFSDFQNCLLSSPCTSPLDPYDYIGGEALVLEEWCGSSSARPLLAVFVFLASLLLCFLL